MSTDKELLELAGKAAGMEIDEIVDAATEEYAGFMLSGTMQWWTPLTDDGDALRLAVSLGLLDGGPIYYTYRTQEIFNGLDPFGATRRAIVRAAAKIGRAA